MAVETRSQTDENPLVEGLERLPVPPTTMVIFGASGDLAHRKPVSYTHLTLPTTPYV